MFNLRFNTGLHPVLTDCALSGLSEILLSRVGTDRTDSTFFASKVELFVNMGLTLEY
jgi:hypothetical protein